MREQEAADVLIVKLCCSDGVKSARSYTD